MDLITTLPETLTGYTAIFVIVDYFTKMAHLIPTKNEVTAAQLATLFQKEIYQLHGLPQTIISDRDPRFMSDLWQTLFKSLKINLNISTSHHPQTDGQTERVNQTIKIMLRFYVNQLTNDWDQYLDIVEYAYNNHENSSTGFSPFFANYGYHPSISWSSSSSNADLNLINQQIHDALTSAQTTYTAYSNLH
jgi:hypothetical protein